MLLTLSIEDGDNVSFQLWLCFCPYGYGEKWLTGSPLIDSSAECDYINYLHLSSVGPERAVHLEWRIASDSATQLLL